MKLEISRSFSRKKQIRQFEPIDVFCSAKTEFEGELEEAAEISNQLYEFCVGQVTADIDRFALNGDNKEKQTVKPL